MPIPDFSEHGTLPNDVYDCSLEEIESIFGRFQSSDCRMNLTKKLKTFVNELRKYGMGVELIVDGSYVTNKEEPGDIDLILVLPEGFDYKAEVKPFEYNLLSNRAVKRLYGFDVFTVSKGSELYRSRIEFFQQVRENPDIRKGLLRVSLS